MSMRGLEYQDPGAVNGFEIDTKGLTAHEVPSTSGPKVMFVGDQCAATESPAAAARSPSPDVVLVSESDPIAT
jgi:hypothetical protein